MSSSRQSARNGVLRRLGFLSLAAGLVLTASGAPDSSGQAQTGGTPTAPVPSVQILRGPLIAPSATTTFYSSTTTTDGLCRDFGPSGAVAPNAEICPTGGRPRPPEIVELARSLGGGASLNLSDTAAVQAHVDLVFEYLRNRADTEFLFGTHKGALGVIIDGSGTPFDQAQLMVETLRSSGVTAGYRYGTLTLTGPQFEAWTGITNAKAACELLATGGIPATVNGSSSSTCALSGNVSQVIMSHVWVQAQVGSSTYFFDPSYKPYEHTTTLPTLAADMGMGVGEIGTQARVGMGGDGVTSVTNQNNGNVAATLEDYAEALVARIRHTPAVGSGVRDLRGGDVWDIVGGRRILPATRPVGGWKQAQPANYVTSATWTGGIPNVFRATLGVTARRPGVTGTLFSVNFYVDEIYGRRLQVFSLQQACVSPCTGFSYAPQLMLDDVPLVVGSPENDQGQLILSMELVANHPFAAAGGTYADATVNKSLDYVLPATIVHGWGSTSPALASLWERERGVDRLAPFTILHGGTVPDEAPQQPVAGDLIRARMAANWLAQFSHARELHAELANSRVLHHHSLGVVSVDANPIYPVEAPPGGEVPPAATGFNLADETAIIDIETAFGLVNRASNVTIRRAALHAIAATAATLEGSVLEQMLDSPDVASTARRFAWGNRPETGETPTTASRSVVKFHSGNVATASGWLVTENLSSGVHGAFTPSGGPTQESISATYANSYRSRLLGAIEAYVGAGYQVIASNEALLGPGHRHGTEYLYNVSYTGSGGGEPIQQYRRHPTLQAGGALIATQYDASGDPTAIAHALTRYSGLFKGGGGPAVTQAQDYDPNQGAEVLRDRFVDNSSAQGVNLMAGTAGYTSPALASIGQGEFPYRLERRVELRGAGLGRPPPVQPNHPDPTDHDGLVTNWHGSVSIGGSGMEGMGASRAEAAAPTIAAFMAMQDVWKEAATPQRELTGMLIADWWGRSLLFNVVTVLQGGGSEQYVRLIDDSFIPTGGGGASLDLAVVRQARRGALIINGQPAPNSVQREAVTRSWILEGVASQTARVTVRGPQGDTRSYAMLAIPTGGDTASYAHYWRLSDWTFPYGVVLTVNYAAGSSTWMTPTSVASNLGYSLAIPSLPEIGCGGTGALQSEVADLTGGVSRAVFNAPVARTVTQRPVAGCATAAIYAGDNLTTPSVAYVYDSVGRIKEARDRGELAAPGSRGFHRFQLAEGYRGERIDPTGGRYAVEVLRGGRTSRYIELASNSQAALAYRTTTAMLDGRGRVVTRTFPEGNQQQFEYDLRDNVTLLRMVADPNRPCALQPVTGTPRLPNGPQTLGACADRVIQATWHAVWNKPTLIIDTGPDGQPRTTTFSYRESGAGKSLLHQALRPDPDTTDGVTQTPTYTFTYNTRGRVLTAVDPTGVTVTSTYDSRQYLTSTSTGWSAEAVVRNYVNDALGNVLRECDPRPESCIVREYDDMRRVIRETHPLGTETRTSYDPVGRPFQVRRRLMQGGVETWAVTRTGYTPTGQVWWVQDPAGDTVMTEYDAMDRRRRVIDAEGVATDYDYDPAGQLIRETRGVLPGVSGSGEVYATYGYTLNGQQAWIRDGRKTGTTYGYAQNTATFEYDGHDRLRRTTWPDGGGPEYSYEQLAYDPAGNVLSRRTREDLLIFTRHDRLDRRVYDGEYWTDGVTLARLQQGHRAYPSSFTYDLAGRMTGASTDSIGRTWQYDTVGRPKLHQRSIHAAGTFQFRYQLGVGNLEEIHYGTTGRIALHEYDLQNRLTDISVNLGGAVHINYDELNRRTSVGFGDGSSQAYSWEIDDDLVQIAHVFPNRTSDNVAFGYGYDRIGRQTSHSISNAAYVWSPLCASGTCTDQYAAATAINTYPSVTGPTFGGTLGLSYGNIGGLPRTGAITGDNLYRYRYDGHGNLVQVRTAANELIRAYTRDALGERYWDRNYVSGDTDRAFRPYSDGIRPEVSLEINYTLANGASSWVQQDTDLYVLGPNPDERLIWIEIAPNGVQTVRYPHTDRRGSTIAVSQGGQAVERYGYGEFGQTAPLTGYPWRYTGQRLDARTGLYDYKAREYAPNLGRFLQPDPLGFVDGPNVYAYVGNDPLGRTDPSGHCSTRALGAAGGAAAADGPLPVGELVGAAVLVGSCTARGYQAYRAWEAARAFGDLYHRLSDGVVSNDRPTEEERGRLHDAGQAADRNNLTLFGRSLQKHSSRPGSAFEPPESGQRASDYNESGSRIASEILNNARTVWRVDSRGRVTATAPDGRMMRWRSNGRFEGFREPRPRRE